MCHVSANCADWIPLPPATSALVARKTIRFSVIMHNGYSEKLVTGILVMDCLDYSECD